MSKTYRCVVKGCGKSGYSEKGLKMFVFPSNKYRKLQWIKFTKYYELLDEPWKTKHVCEYHFANNAFTNESRKSLNRNAVPTLYLPTEISTAVSSADLDVSTNELPACEIESLPEHITNCNPDVTTVLIKKGSDFTTVYIKEETYNGEGKMPISEATKQEEIQSVDNENSNFNHFHVKDEPSIKEEPSFITDATASEETKNINNDLDVNLILQIKEEPANKDLVSATIGASREDETPNINNEDLDVNLILQIKEEPANKDLVSATSDATIEDETPNINNEDLVCATSDATIEVETPIINKEDIDVNIFLQVKHEPHNEVEGASTSSDGLHGEKDSKTLTNESLARHLLTSYPDRSDSDADKNEPTENTQGDDFKRRMSKLTCQHCQRCFLFSTNLEKHLLTHHSTAEKNEKSESHKKQKRAHSDSISNLESDNAIKKSISNAKYQARALSMSCTQCSQCFATSRSLQKHLWTHKKMKSCTCPQCGECFTDAQRLQAHILTHKRISKLGTPHECEHCGKCFARSVSLHRHVLTHKDIVILKCHHCGKCFESPRSLRNHLLVHRPHRCVQCKQSFERLRSLQSHILTYHTTRPYKCSVCLKCFINEKWLMSHLIFVHEAVEAQICPYCFEGFTAETKLSHHLTRMHSDLKPHKCLYCSESCSTKKHLDNHLKTHTNVIITKKSYECPRCNKSFAEDSDLRKHFLTHGGNKPHKCTQCDRCFTLSSSLERHALTHTTS